MIATDKAQHFTFCAVVAAAAYSLSARAPKLPPFRFAVAAAASAAAGLLKEIGDAVQVQYGYTPLTQRHAHSAKRAHSCFRAFQTWSKSGAIW